jgi:hypothetical protein
MSRISIGLCAVVLMLCCAVPMSAQQAAATTTVVPQIVKFSGTLTDAKGAPLTGTVGATFALYQSEQGGSALWVETQNVTPDKAGHYTVTLGSTTSQGIPASVFANGEARWLGVQVQGEAEKPRTLLMSVPYALKALDAETIGGKPASSFMLTPQAGGKSAPGKLPPGTITGSGTADFIPRFTGATTLGNSNLFETVGGNVGIATTTPAAKLDVKGKVDVRDTLTLFPSGTHPTLSVHGTAFEVSNTGLVTFVSGQTFPGTGTVTSVGSGAGLTGGPITHSGTLSIKTGGVTNTMLAHSSITVNAGTDLTGGGTVPLGGSVTLNLNTGAVPTLGGANSFTNNNAISVNSSSPDLSLSNSGSGDGVDITLATGIGVDVFAGEQGIHATTSGDAGVFEGGFDGSYNSGAGAIGAGVWAENETASTDAYASVGFAGGSSGENFGVWGYSGSDKGLGLYGEGVDPSKTGGTCCAGAYPIGSWSDTNGNGGEGIGALTTVDAGWSIVSYNNSSSTATILAENDASSGPIIEAYSPSGFCQFNVGGSFECSGSKSAVVPVDGGARKVALYAIEGPENWFEDAGSAHLTNGEAVVDLEGTFGQTVNTDVDYHVFLTPDGDCKGLYVAQKSSTSFVVRELGGGTSSIPFDYRIMAKRKGYEQIRLADRTKEFPGIAPHAGAKPSTPRPTPQELREKHRQAAQRRAVAQLKPMVKH